MPTQKPTSNITVAISGPILLQIWENFQVAGFSYAAPVSAAQLRGQWFQVESQLEEGSRFKVGRTVIKDCIDHVAPYICDEETEIAALDRWLHALLCCCAGATARVATRRLQALIKACLRSVDGHKVLMEDLTKNSFTLGRLKDVLSAICDKTMKAHEEETGVPAVQGIDAEQLARISMQAVGFTGNEFITYLQLLAMLFGRFLTPVKLHLYDLSKGYAQTVIPNLEGVWHTGVVVYGREYFYNGRPVFEKPGGGDFGEVRKTIDAGATLYKQDELHAYIYDFLAPRYTIDTYDTLQHNCCNFCDEVMMFLLRKHLQDEVLYQQNRLLDIPGVRMLWPAIRGMISSCNADSRKHAQLVTACANTGAGIAENAALIIEDRQSSSANKVVGDMQPLEPEDTSSFQDLKDMVEAASEVSTSASSCRQEKERKEDGYKMAMQCHAQLAEMTRDLELLLTSSNERNAETPPTRCSPRAPESEGLQSVRRSMTRKSSWKNLFSAMRRPSLGSQSGSK